VRDRGDAAAGEAQGVAHPVADQQPTDQGAQPPARQLAAQGPVGDAGPAIVDGDLEVDVEVVDRGEVLEVDPARHHRVVVGEQPDPTEVARLDRLAFGAGAPLLRVARGLHRVYPAET